MDKIISALGLLGFVTACGVETSPRLPGESMDGVYADRVVDFSPGSQAGFGQDAFPDIVLGAPQALSSMQGSLHVLSLGAGGSITLALSTPAIDGPGPDIAVYENVFWAMGDSSHPYAELGVVSVSVNGQDFVDFDCPQERSQPPWDGCAGWTPTTEGGDRFDLSEVGLSEATYVRITDTSTYGVGITAGFDLDAIEALHF